MFTGISLGAVVAIIAVIALLGIIASGYVKAPPDTAFIISGLRKKIIIGKSSIKIPFLERLDKLSLKLIPIDVKTEAAVPTADYINIQVDAAVNVKVSSEPEKLKQAAENFLNQNTQYIAQVAREVLEGNMREIVGRMRLEEMVSDRQKFADLVKENAEPDLAAMGLDVVSFNVQNFTDSNGVIDDLGIDNISQIKKKAAIAKAEAEKEIAVAKAEADRQSNDARINSEREIAIKNNELDMQKAELQKNADSKRADAAYEIQKEEQRKTIEVTAANANIAKEERLVLLKQREAETMEKSLDAQVKKKAEAEKFERQQKAEAELFERQKEAEAKKFETEKAAEAQRAKAEADLFSKEQEAKGIRMVGEAEAEAIRAKGVAEAEAMEKRAQAYQKYNNAAMAEMLIKVLPDIAGKIAEPLTQIDKITIIGGSDGSNGVDQVAGNVPAVMTKLFETMKETVGIDLAEVVKAGTYDAKVNRNITINADGAKQAAEVLKQETAAEASAEIVE